MKLKEFATKTQHIADSLCEDDNWDQSVGGYASDIACCVGAHLARFFGVTAQDQGVPRDEDEIGAYASTDYIRGRQAACEYIGCTQSQLNLMLHAAGAPWNPFSPGDWHNPIGIVWRNLAQIETLPPEATTDDLNRTARWIANYHIRFGIRHT